MREIMINGQTLPALGMGSWHLGQGYHDASDEIHAIQSGIDAGIQLIDTAEMYGKGRSEQLIGQAIQGRRDQIFLVTKVYPWNANRLLMEKSCDNSLKRLGTDHIDLYLLHWRFGSLLKEAITEFEKLKTKGKILSWGVSNFDVSDMNDVVQHSSGKHCAANQVFYNPGSRGIEFDLLPWCRHQSMPVMAYSPLDGQGAALLKHPLFNDLAHKHQTSASAVILAWIMRGGSIMPIPESGTAQHVMDNKDALTLQLDEHDLTLIEQAFPPPYRKVPLETR